MIRRTLCAWMFFLAACSHSPAVLEPQGAWVGECIDSSKERVDGALASVPLSSNGSTLISQLLLNLPPRESEGIAAALAAATEMLGHVPTRLDVAKLRDKIAWQAFFTGLDKAPTCDVEDGWVTVEFFTSSIMVHLYERKIDVSAAFAELGSPPSDFNSDHEELKIWLLLGAAGAL